MEKTFVLLFFKARKNQENVIVYLNQITQLDKVSSSFNGEKRLDARCQDLSESYHN